MAFGDLLSKPKQYLWLGTFLMLKALLITYAGNALSVQRTNKASLPQKRPTILASHKN